MNKKKSVIVIISILVLAVVGCILYFVFSGNNKTESVLLKDVKVLDHSCEEDKCLITFESSVGIDKYTTSKADGEVIGLLFDYADYVRLDVYYDNKDTNKKVVKYKLYLKTNDKEISVSNEKELREKIGLYDEGKYTQELTFIKNGEYGISHTIEGTSLYYEYVFTNDNNMTYTMTYYSSKDELNLTKDKKYKVTFEVSKDEFFDDFKYTIISVE